MRAGRAAPFQRRYAVLAPVLERTFDVRLILHSVVGPRWTSLPVEQQERLLALFTAFTAASYVSSFDSYSGQRFEVARDARAAGGDQVAQTRITRANGEAVKIDYVMRRADTGWLVADVLLDGSISRVAVLRSDFRALIGPGDATRLIDSLRGKVADLSGRALMV